MSFPDEWNHGIPVQTATFMLNGFAPDDLVLSRALAVPTRHSVVIDANSTPEQQEEAVRKWREALKSGSTPRA